MLAEQEHQQESATTCFNQVTPTCLPTSSRSSTNSIYRDNSCNTNPFNRIKSNRAVTNPSNLPSPLKWQAPHPCRNKNPIKKRSARKMLNISHPSNSARSRKVDHRRRTRTNSIKALQRQQNVV